MRPTRTRWRGPARWNDHPAARDGIAYRSSHNDALVCVALYSHRAADALAVQGSPRRLDRQPKLLATAVQRDRLDLIPSLPEYPPPVSSTNG